MCVCLFWLLFSADDWWPATTLEEFSRVSNYVRPAASECRASPSTASQHPQRRGERVPSGTETRQLEDVCVTHAHKHSQPQSVLATSLLNKHTWGWWWCDDFLNVENPPCSIFSQMLWLQSCTHFSVQFLSSNLNFYFENEMAEYLCHFSLAKNVTIEKWLHLLLPLGFLYNGTH